MVTAWQRRLFDEKLDALVAQLPEHIHDMMEEVPVIVEDEPGRELLADLGMEADDDLCGLHSGVALTDRSVEAPPEIPDQIMIFRGPIIRLAQSKAPGTGPRAVQELVHEIRVTLLHEIGHHFGLDEDDLDRLGYA